MITGTYRIFKDTMFDHYRRTRRYHWYSKHKEPRLTKLLHLIPKGSTIRVIEDEVAFNIEFKKEE
jgi:hypothetical protein